MKKVPDNITIDFSLGWVKVDIKEIVSKVDHTLLSPISTFSDIKNLCDEGMKYGVASVCIPPCFVKKAKNYVENNLKICTVIGFPNGYNDESVKIFEATHALEAGADEIDMVINIGFLKEKNYSKVLSEIKNIKDVCGDKILKVIIETCLLSQEEKINMCKIVSDSGADFIKTSTGFSKSGAKIEDVILFKKYIDKNVKIKAAGGISSLEDAEKFISAGASRLGTSKIIKIIKEIWQIWMRGNIFWEPTT